MADKRGRAWWDKFYVDMAEFMSTASKDRWTKVGAVLVGVDNYGIGHGFNGFPRGVADTEKRLSDRVLKNRLTLHAERNAILSSNRDLVGACLYTWPLPSCSDCTAMMIQAGIKRHVAPAVPSHLVERWQENIDLALSMYKEAGVEVVIL